jgi:phosphatidylserine/phosphatidylglycerophosphate/cardiolipin synthase-like enzyme
MKPFSSYSSRVLEDLAHLLQSGEAPSIHRLEAALGKNVVAALGPELDELRAQGWTCQQIAQLAFVLVNDRKERERLWSWVVSGPMQDGVPTRDTGVVYRSLVQEAQEEILLTSYALYRGRELLEPLHERILEVPGLRVRMILDISRPYRDTTASDVIIRRFASDFVTKHWPWTPLPEVLYDPRALDLDPVCKAVLHAKCVIVDRQVALVTSANLTHAAQEKNIEAGVLVRDPEKAGSLQDFFESLIKHGVLEMLK